MIRLLQWLIFGHAHQWETEKVCRLTTSWGGTPSSTGDRYILRCSKCGHVKKRDLV